VREAIGPLLMVVFVVCVVAFLFELAIAAASKKPADPIATGVLGSIITACIPVLAGLYRAEVKREQERPPDPPAAKRPVQVEETGDEESDKFNREAGWLEMARGVRWSLL
jgi:hypothetical protein